MTSADMKQEFLILYDKITNFAAPGYEDIEISRFLTKAQERVFLSIYSPLKNRFKEGFEETEKRRKELANLVENVSIVPLASGSENLPNGYFVNLPDDLLFAISEEGTIVSNNTCYNGKRIRIVPTLHDEYSINKTNPWKKPSPKTHIWRLDYNTNRHELITDGTFTISSYHLRYLRKLNPIIIDASTIDGVVGPQDCELGEILHKRIVEEAVKIATGVTDPQFYQIKSLEQQTGES